MAAGSGETPASHTFGAMVRLLQALFSIEVVLDHLRNEAFTVIFSPFHCVPPKKKKVGVHGLGFVISLG